MYLRSCRPNLVANPVNPFVHIRHCEHLRGSRVGNRILCRLCKYSRCHCMTKHPAQYRLLQPRAIGQLSICDSILVFKEVLCYLETINGVETD